MRWPWPTFQGQLRICFVNHNSSLHPLLKWNGNGLCICLKSHFWVGSTWRAGGIRLSEYSKCRIVHLKLHTPNTIRGNIARILLSQDNIKVSNRAITHVWKKWRRHGILVDLPRATKTHEVALTYFPRSQVNLSEFALWIITRKVELDYSKG